MGVQLSYGLEELGWESAAPKKLNGISIRLLKVPAPIRSFILMMKGRSNAMEDWGRKV